MVDKDKCGYSCHILFWVQSMNVLFEFHNLPIFGQRKDFLPGIQFECTDPLAISDSVSPCYGCSFLNNNNGIFHLYQVI